MRAMIGLMRSLVIYYNPRLRTAQNRFYGQFLDQSSLAFDIGAHVGNRSRAMHKAGARVVAFEPQEPFAAFLAHTLPRGITLVRKALGPTETAARMAVSSLHPTVSSLSETFPDEAGQAPGFARVKWDKQQQVQVTTLDRMIDQFGLPDFTKIDVEGYELNVLAGLSQPLPLLSVEYLPELADRTFAVIDRILELGDYRFNIVKGEATQFLWPDWQGADLVRDWLAALSDDAGSGDLYARLETQGASHAS